MITYELLLLFRVMPKNELVPALKRTANAIFEKSGIIRRIEHLGTRDMPYKTSMHGLVHKRASYFLMEFNVPPTSLEDLQEEYGRDVDIIRRRIFKSKVPIEMECTLHEEIQPAPYRKDVQELMASARKLDKTKFKYNTGLDYYPFQK